VWISNLISIASTYRQPIAHNSTDASIVKFLTPPTSYDASMFGCAAGFNLSVPPMNGRRFQTPPVGQLLPSARTADLSEDGETLNSDDDDDDDDDLPPVKQIWPLQSGQSG
jgi:hypothetical protein